MDIKAYEVGMLQTNCYVVGGDDGLVIIDPGYAGAKLCNEIDSDGRKPVAILLTHGHFDHTMGVDYLVERYDIPVYALDKERETIESSAANLSTLFSAAGIHSDTEITYFSEGDVLEFAGLSFETLWIPGHSVGGCCYYLRSDNVIFSGDNLFYGSVGRSDLPGGSMSAMINGIKEKLFALPDETMVYPGHGPETSIGFEKQYNPFIR